MVFRRWAALALLIALAVVAVLTVAPSTSPPAQRAAVLAVALPALVVAQEQARQGAGHSYSYMIGDLVSDLRLRALGMLRALRSLASWRHPEAHPLLL